MVRAAGEEPGRRRSDTVERRSHRLGIGPAIGIEHDPPTLAIEQRRLEPVLEQCHLAADGALGQPYLIAGS